MLNMRLMWEDEWFVSNLMSGGGSHTIGVAAKPGRNKGCCGGAEFEYTVTKQIMR